MNKRGIATALVLAIIFGLTTVGLATYIVYDNIKTNNNETQTNIESTIENEQKDDIKNEETSIPTGDLFAYWAMKNEMVSLKIEDDTLYSYAINVTPEVENAYMTFDSASANYKKLLDNVKRIKTFHVRTDVMPTFYAILNDGTVKVIAIPIDDPSYTVKVSDNSIFDGYKVDDILSTKGEGYEEHSVTFELKLQDGSTVKVR